MNSFWSFGFEIEGICLEKDYDSIKESLLVCSEFVCNDSVGYFITGDETISIDDEAVKKRFLNVHCAEIVYPYARENISNIILKGGFPPLFLSPIDFHTIYQNELDKRKDN